MLEEAPCMAPVRASRALPIASVSTSLARVPGPPQSSVSSLENPSVTSLPQNTHAMVELIRFP